MILCNPPFYDDENPRIDMVVLPDMQELGGTVKIIAKITDNSGIEKQDISFNLTYQDGTDEYSGDFEFNDNIFVYTFSNPDNLLGNFNYKITATVKYGHKTEKQGTFTYSNDTIKIPSPKGVTTSPGPTVGYADTIKFDVSTNVSRIYYKIDGGKEINVTEREGDYYITYPEYQGWPKNKNVTMRVYAEVVYYFEEVIAPQTSSKLTVQQFNNTIVDSQVYYFNVGDDEEIGTKEPPKASLPGPTYVQVPGFELIVFIVSLGITVLIFKYRRKNKRR